MVFLFPLFLFLCLFFQYSLSLPAFLPVFSLYFLCIPSLYDFLLLFISLLSFFLVVFQCSPSLPSCVFCFLPFLSLVIYLYLIFLFSSFLFPLSTSASSSFNDLLSCLSLPSASFLSLPFALYLHLILFFSSFLFLLQRPLMILLSRLPLPRAFSPSIASRRSSILLLSS